MFEKLYSWLIDLHLGDQGLCLLFSFEFFSNKLLKLIDDFTSLFTH